MRLRLAELFTRKEFKISGKVFRDLRGILLVVAIRLDKAENRFVHGGKLRRYTLFKRCLLFREIAKQNFLRARQMFLIDYRKELGSGRHPDNASNHRFQKRRHLVRLQHLRHSFPSAAVGRLFESLVLASKGGSVKHFRVFRDKIDYATIQPRLRRPQQPFLHGGLEFVDIEAAHESWIQIGQLIFFAIVHRANHARAFGQLTARKHTIQCQVHNGLQHLGTGAVQFIQEQHHRLAVGRKPVWQHKQSFSCRLVKSRKPNQVAGIAHLSQKQNHHAFAASRKKLLKNLRLTDSVFAREHYVLRCGSRSQQSFQFQRINFYRHNHL